VTFSESEQISKWLQNLVMAVIVGYFGVAYFCPAYADAV